MAAPRRPLILATCLLMGFVAILAVRSRGADPSARLPRRYQLAGLIESQRKTTTDLQHQVEDLRKQVEQLRAARAGQDQGVAGREAHITEASTAAGLSALLGAGLKVTLDDSDLDRSKLDQSLKANVNDLVIHSQDVQAVVNALWRSGSEAVAVNGQRLVTTSAVLCVGNTLLVNGSVFSPPYEIAGIGADHDRFEGDRLVKRLHADADAFGLRFSVSSDDHLKVPAFAGAVAPQLAKPQR
jgi:uncharacterized protein YlxW (UPF0749 family)